MVYLLDTDHAALLMRGGADGVRIRERVRGEASESVRVSIVSAEEQARGWLAQIAASRSVDRHVSFYERLEHLFHFYQAVLMLPFDQAALEHFQGLWLLRLRVGTMDLKIASIALAHDAVLLTRNRRDFEKIPGLRLDDWSAETSPA